MDGKNTHRNEDEQNPGLLACGIGDLPQSDSELGNFSLCEHCGKKVPITGICSLCENTLASSSHDADAARNGFIVLRDALGIGDEREDVIDMAVEFFKMAVDNNFTQDQKIQLVHASCFYSACRAKNLPFLLIHFSSHLGVSIYELGSLQLEFCEILDKHISQSYEHLLDPSIFIPSFSNCLFKGTDDEAVMNIARDLIAGIDWKQTGLKFSEICGQALYSAALSLNIKCALTDIDNIVNSYQALVLFLSPVRNDFFDWRVTWEIVNEGGDVIDMAGRFYTMANEQNFTKRWKTEIVKASCLYLTCMVKNLPFLLIDFSSYLRVSIYEMGSVYLQLCETLNIAEYRNYEKILDPSVFIPSFSKCLLSKETYSGIVLRRARDIIASMKRDWIENGWKISDICGAALYTAALSNGSECSKTDTVDVMHGLEAAVIERLIKFGDTHTESSNVDALTEEERKFLTWNVKYKCEDGVLCMHKGEGCKLFGYTLCRSCYNHFIIVSSGLVGGSNPFALEQELLDSYSELFDGCEFKDTMLLERYETSTLLKESMKCAEKASSLMEALKQTGGPRLEDAHKKIQVAISSLDAARIMVDESCFETQETQTSLHSEAEARMYGRVYVRKRK